jgi:hypothetical protein
MIDALEPKHCLFKRILYLIAGPALPFGIVIAFRFWLISLMEPRGTAAHGPMCGTGAFVLIGFPLILASIAGYALSLLLGALAYRSFARAFTQGTFAQRLCRACAIGWVLLGFPLYLLAGISVMIVLH